MLELQGHGSPAVMNLLLTRVLSLGARMARPGEFTERAFLNDKLDLAQAEAVGDLIASSSHASARAAVRSLSGVFSEQIYSINKELTDLRVYIEAALDFAEEEIDFLSSGELQSRVENLQLRFAELKKQVKHGRVLREGISVVIAGAPNAGKSSLLNCLSGEDSAIVTHVAGTTRDVLRELIQIDGMPVRIIDTAGLHQSDDPVEQEGIKRALAEMKQANRILWLVDSASDQLAAATLDKQFLSSAMRSAMLGEETEKWAADVPVDLVLNKCDLTGEPATITKVGENVVISLSARTGEGVELLKTHLKEVAGFVDDNEGSFIARSRHLDAVQRASVSISAALKQMHLGNAELAAEDFRLGQDALSEITGEFSSDDLLGEIFSSFCIGK